jgi:hypothetical protein
VTNYAVESYNHFTTGGQYGNTLTETHGYDLDLPNGDPLAPVPYTGADSFNTINGNAFVFTVTVVPEPSSMLLCGLGVSGGLFALYRRRQLRAVAVEKA